MLTSELARLHRTVSSVLTKIRDGGSAEVLVSGNWPLTPETVQKYVERPLGEGVTKVIIEVDDGNDNEVCQLVGAWTAVSVPVEVKIRKLEIVTMPPGQITFGLTADEAYIPGDPFWVPSTAYIEAIQTFFADDGGVTVTAESR